MAKVIPFPGRPHGPDNLIIDSPFTFRRAEWRTEHPVQVQRPKAEAYEIKRRRAFSVGEPAVPAPIHKVLTGSLGQTLRGLYRAREDEDRMRRIYFLAGLMELATGHSHELLRTDLVRRVFGRIKELSEELNLRWRSWAEGFLLPLAENQYPTGRLPDSLGRAGTLKELMEFLRLETDAQFKRAARDYVYYLPPSWVGPGRVKDH